MKKKKYLKESTHRRTYNIVRKETFAVCSRCRWHAGFWSWCFENPFVRFYYMEDGSDKPERQKFKGYPNWKLVSKNRKQWIKKQYLHRRYNRADGSFIIYYYW